jgi:hypothetical protein
MGGVLEPQPGWVGATRAGPADPELDLLAPGEPLQQLVRAEMQPVPSHSSAMSHRPAGRRHRRGAATFAGQGGRTMDQPTTEPSLQALEHLLIVHLGSVLARDLPAGVTNLAGPCLRPSRCRGIVLPVHRTRQPSETISAELQSGRRARRRERLLADDHRQPCQWPLSKWLWHTFLSVLAWNVGAESPQRACSKAPCPGLGSQTQPSLPGRDRGWRRTRRLPCRWRAAGRGFPPSSPPPACPEHTRPAAEAAQWFFLRDE